jgi:type II secretion system protein G
MFKKTKGFTLIELLIVVAIIGILAALLIPNAITAMQKSKQKATMKDIMTIATALTDHVTDNGNVPAHTGRLADSSDAFIPTISPFYVKVCPWADKWGYGYVINTRDAITTDFGVVLGTGETAGDDDFVVGSTGRDGAVGGPVGYAYDPTDSESGWYLVVSMGDFDEDLANWNGNWVVGPRTYSAPT